MEIGSWAAVGWGADVPSRIRGAGLAFLPPIRTAEGGGRGGGLAKSVLRSRFGISSSSPLNVKVNHVIERTNTAHESLPVLVGYN
jgi:hypothetical protein